MNNILSFFLGGILLGSNKETTIVKEVEKKVLVGKCKACPEIGLFREDLGFCADEFCYKMYLKYKK